MATYYARKAGNVNATDVWATTPSGQASDVFSSLTNQDVLVSNSFTVTLNVNTTVAEVRNDAFSGATAGGSFTLASGVTLTANVIAGSATCVNHTTGNATIVGNVNGGTANSASGVGYSSTGNLAITGAVTGGSASSAMGVNHAGSGILTITGNITGGSGSAARGVSVNAGQLVVSGNVTGTANVDGVYSQGTSTTITGTVFGTTNFATYGAQQFGAGSCSIVGTAVGGSSGPGFFHVGTGTAAVTRAKGGASASAAVGVVGSTTGSTSVEEIEYGDLGASPVSGPIRLADKTSNVAVMYRFGTTKKTLVDPNASGLMPAASNVRSGVVYNGGNSTGTCAVPAAGSVALGVPVDATTGTAALTPAAVWDYLTASATTAGSMGERLKSAATVASTGQALADALTP